MAANSALYQVGLGTNSRYRKLPVIGPLLDDWLAWLRSCGYKESTIRNNLSRAACVCRWLQRRCGRAFGELGEGDLRAAYDHFHRRRIEVASIARILDVPDAALDHLSHVLIAIANWVDVDARDVLSLRIRDLMNKRGEFVHRQAWALVTRAL